MKLIFGDNQFFGINHMSEDKAQVLAERFCTVDAMIRVIDEAYEAGIRDFMFTTHDRVAEICDHFRRFPAQYSDLKLYPAMPYAHKYANLVTDKGILGALIEVLRGSGSGSGALRMVVRAGVGAMQQDPIAMMHLLIDAELQMFRGLCVEAVFLQNIVTDLVFGMGAQDALLDFVQYAKDRHSVDAGFITMNLPALSAALRHAGLQEPLLCASFNKAGYLMNPSKQAYEQTVREGRQRFIAMSVFASGAVPPREASEYVAGFDNIDGVLFGASSKDHIGETVQLFQTQSAPVMA
ncbi:MAG: hypothetical protein ACLGSD_10740 [Acidobacteriota bacterium]